MTRAEMKRLADNVMLGWVKLPQLKEKIKELTEQEKDEFILVLAEKLRNLEEEYYEVAERHGIRIF
jgi:hypothetical protein